MEEMWKDVPEFEGCYQISNLGRVRSIDRKFKSKDGRNWSIKGRIDNPTISSKGYFHKRFKYNGKQKNYKIHRLVGLLFLTNSSNLLEINHKDGNKLNNNAENLEWCSRQQNMNHASINGLLPRKLDSKKIIIIREKYINGSSKESLAKEFNVTIPCIHSIIIRHTWKHVV